MLTQILEAIQGWRPMRILLVSVLVSELVSTLVVSGLSLLIHGRLRGDFLITGSITALLTSLVVVSILMRLFHMLRSTRQALQQERDRLFNNAAALRESEERYRTLFESTLHDLNERKKLEAALLEAKDRAEAASKAKSDFLSTMSHEIRTPMNVVIAMGEMLYESSLTPDQKTMVNRLQTAGNILLTLINQILDLAKIEAGQIQLVAKPLHIATMLQKMTDMLRPLAQDKNLRLECQVADDLPAWLLMDGDRLNQVLMNLLGNALKFTQKGSISLKANCGMPSTWHLSVTDSGIGMESSQLERIFDAFTQVDASITRSYGGTGLGLTISRKLVTMMGGSLWVESQAGVGSTFHITLPLTPCAAPASSPVLDPTPPDQHPLRLLMVDDTEDNHMVVQAFLANTPHHLTTAYNGEEAVHQVKQHPFDVILMDMQMPIMDGYTATRLIRQWEHANQRRPVFIAALTAHALSEDSQESLEAGCNLHLTKPLRKRKLMDVLQEIGKQIAVRPPHPPQH
ncbi:MAG: response regulator [Magnetococcales bacterium]|nr:response regulator [Magnetococcales bacterium]